MLQTNVEEYFKIKRMLKELNGDLRDFKKNHDLHEEIEEFAKKLKKMRNDLMSEQVIVDLKEEIDSAKERLGLLKEIIRQEMLDEGTDEVPFEGRKIKLVQVMKEVKDEESGDLKGKVQDRTDIEIDPNLNVL